MAIPHLIYVKPSIKDKAPNEKSAIYIMKNQKIDHAPALERLLICSDGSLVPCCVDLTFSLYRLKECP
jgi:hypothetical protein